MLNLIFAIISIVLATASIFMIIALIIHDGLKNSLREVIMSFLCCALFVFSSIVSFNSYKERIESNAIDHYIVGDYELIEKVVNGQVVDWQYKITPADYE